MRNPRLQTSLILGYQRLPLRAAISPGERKAQERERKHALAAVSSNNPLSVIQHSVDVIARDAKALLDQRAVREKIIFEIGKLRREAQVRQLRAELLESQLNQLVDQPDNATVYDLLERMLAARQESEEKGQDPDYEPPRQRPRSSRRRAAAPAAAAPAPARVIARQAAPPAAPPAAPAQDGKDAKQPAAAWDFAVEDVDEDAPMPDFFEPVPPVYDEKAHMQQLQLVASIMNTIDKRENKNPELVCALNCAEFSTDADPNGTLREMFFPHLPFSSVAGHCPHQMHAVCFENWALTLLQGRKSHITCPICRAKWVAFARPDVVLGPLVPESPPSGLMSQLQLGSPSSPPSSNGSSANSSANS